MKTPLSVPVQLDPSASLAETQALLAQLQTQLSQRDQQIRTLEIKNQKLAHELAVLKRLRFGRKAESLSADQRSLFEEELDQDLAAVSAELESESPNTSGRKPRTRAGRQPLEAHLERIEVRHELEHCTCGQCQADLIKIGEDVSEQLDVEPSRFFVIRHIRPQYACRQCETITAAPVPPAVIDGGIAAPGLMAWITVSKYLDHLPLYRLEQIAARKRVNLPRSSQSEWAGRVGFAMQPLADRMAELLRKQDCLHADETPVQQLDPGQGKTKKAYLWAYRSNDLGGGPPIVVFDYQTSRSGAHAGRFLQEWTGALMVDDFSGYKALFGNGIIELGCWAHARRKFFDLQAAGQHPVATQALQRIADLYAVETQLTGLALEERTQLRLERSKPLLEDLRHWLIERRASAANGGALAKAIDYTLRRWSALARYAEDGAYPIDNNPVENAIRPIALGKKNWLFAGSERAGKRAAAIQSLLITAKLNGLDPAAWLKDTLEKLPSWPNSRIDELLPLRT